MNRDINTQKTCKPYLRTRISGLAILLLIVVSQTGCASAAKTAAKTTVTGAKVSARTTAATVKTVGKGAASVAVGTAHVVTGHDDEEVDADR